MKSTKQWYKNSIASALGIVLLGSVNGVTFANGTETLGTPSVKVESGTGIESAGTGLLNQPGMIEIDVPGEIKQALLYWECQSNLTTPPKENTIVGDNTIIIGGQLVQGDLIGGPTRFFSTRYSTTFRADITDLDLIAQGENILDVEGLDCTGSNNGAGLMVIYNDNSQKEAEILLKDGNDLAFHRFTPPLDTTIPQTFTFEASDHSRTAQLRMFFSSVSGSASGSHGFRPSAIEVTVGEITTVYDDLLDSHDGDEWDTINLDITIPENESMLTVQALSVDNLPLSDPGLPASFAWNAAALFIKTPDEICGSMKGRGKIKGTRITHSFSLNCDINKHNQLQLNWITYGKKGNYGRFAHSNRFRLTSLDEAVCSNNKNINKRWNSNSFNTIFGKGKGKYNGNDAQIEFTFVDSGRNGRKETAEITITDKKGNVVLTESGKLKRGNHVAKDCTYKACYTSNKRNHHRSRYLKKW